MINVALVCTFAPVWTLHYLLGYCKATFVANKATYGQTCITVGTVGSFGTPYK